MKLLSIIVFIFSAYSFGQTTVGLTASYLFENNINDGIGSNTLNFNGTGVIPTPDRFGNLNCAYYFPSILSGSYTLGDTNSYLYLDNPNQDLDVSFSNGWSISLWYKGGSTAAGDFERIFSRTNTPAGTTDQDCHTIGLYDINTPITTVFKDFPSSNGSNFIWANQTTSILDSTLWHHVVMVANPGNVISFYVDNVLQDTILNPSLFDVCNSKLYIGYNFTGKIDDIHYYQTALSTTDISGLFNATSTCGPLKIEDKSLLNFNIYPNPATNEINILIDEINHNTKVSIYNLQGQLILEKAIKSSQSKVNISTFSKGIYFVKIANGSDVKTEKLVIK